MGCPGPLRKGPLAAVLYADNDRRRVQRVNSIGNFPDYRPAHRRRSRRRRLSHRLLDPGGPDRLSELADRPVDNGDRQHRDRDDRAQHTCNRLRRHTRNSSSLPTPTSTIARKPTSSNQQLIVDAPCLTSAPCGACEPLEQPLPPRHPCSQSMSRADNDERRSRGFCSSFDCNNRHRACQTQMHVLHCACSSNASRSLTAFATLAPWLDLAHGIGAWRTGFSNQDTRTPRDEHVGTAIPT
jgi:hypothetical protein